MVVPSFMIYSMWIKERHTPRAIIKTVSSKSPFYVACTLLGPLSSGADPPTLLTISMLRCIAVLFVRSHFGSRHLFCYLLSSRSAVQFRVAIFRCWFLAVRRSNFMLLAKRRSWSSYLATVLVGCRPWVSMVWPVLRWWWCSMMMNVCVSVRCPYMYILWMLFCHVLRRLSALLGSLRIEQGYGLRIRR